MVDIQAAVAQERQDNNTKGSSQDILQGISPGSVDSHCQQFSGHIFYNRLRRLPSELINWILVIVLADSVHTISISDVDVSWEMNVVSTLSAVSSRFRAIVLDIAAQAFNIKEGEKWSVYVPFSPFINH
jgi:hypothetical protein